MIVRTLIVALYLWVLIIPGSAFADSMLRFYYFNPDSPQNNLSRLKSDMASLFKGMGVQVEFQPFARLSDFDQGVRNDHPSFVFAPEWYLHRYANELNFSPLLQSVRNAQNSYRKLLIGRRHATGKVLQFGRASLAMTNLGPDSSDIIKRIEVADSTLNIEQLSIVEVPKDADALFAAALGQVEIALVSQTNLEQFHTINPKLVDSLQVLGESEPLKMPVLGYIEGASTVDQQNKFKKFMISTRESPVMKTLQIDGWSVYD